MIIILLLKLLIGLIVLISAADFSPFLLHL